MPATDIQFAKHFIKATKHVLSTMASVYPTHGAPYIKKDHAATGDVSAIIGLAGDKCGSVSISFSKRCAVFIVKKMLGDDIEDIMQDSKDAVGEIINMISGQARGSMSIDGIKMQASTPTIVFGDKHSIRHVSTSAVIAIPFSTEKGDFTLEFCFAH